MFRAKIEVLIFSAKSSVKYSFNMYITVQF